MKFALAVAATLGALVFASSGASAAPTWTLLADFDKEATVLTVQPDDAQTLWAAFRTTVADSAGVWTSADGGATWSLAFDSQGVIVNAVAVDPENPSYVWVGKDANKANVSTDGGTTWNEITGFGFGNKVFDIAIPNGNDPVLGPYRVYFATTNGVYYTLDGGQTLTQVSGLIPMNHIAVCPDDHLTVWAGTKGAGGLSFTTDGGATWTDIDTANFNDKDRARGLGINGNDCAEILFSAWTPNQSPYTGITTDSGTTWTELDVGTGEGVMVNTAANGTFYGVAGGEGGVFFSSTGMAFDAFPDGLADFPVLVAGAADDGMDLYCATETKIYSMTANFHPGAPTGIEAACSGEDEVTVNWDTVTLNADGSLADDLAGYVIWAIVPPFSQNRDTVDVVADPLATEYVHTNSIFPVLQYTVSAYDSAGIGGAEGDAGDVILIPDDCETGIEDGVPGLGAGLTALAQNSPNPFNPRTAIDYQVAESEAGQPLSLAVYDARGSLVRRLVDGPALAGSHRTSWDGKDASGNTVASGAYFARLSVGSVHQVRSMLLVK